MSDGTSDERTSARVTAFRSPLEFRVEPLEALRRGRVRVRVTHASVGATDLLAARGGYVLQPRAGFVTGYDFVGEHDGKRVAGVLPRMGAHRTVIDVPPSLLVPVPDALSSAQAATLPLDLVTASLALRLVALHHGTLLVQGVTGAVGALVAQLAQRAALTVVGTASERTRSYADSRGIEILDHTDPAWAELLRTRRGGVDGAIDHTGSSLVRRAVRPTGRIVRTAFAGRVGHERRDTAVGAARTLALRWGGPGERLCSVPAFVAVRRQRYRAVLAEALRLAAAELIVPPEPIEFGFADAAAAFAAAAHPEPGHKVVLRLP